MKILFYLPVITPWWFDDIIAPMLRALHGAADLHVMVAPLWRNTGVEAEQLAPVADLDQVQWHVIDADDPGLFRTDACKVDGLLDLVADIDPDITLARSADFVTPSRFPGTVRYIMEGAAAPFSTDPRWVVLDARPFTHGIMPANAEAIADRCAAALDEAWRTAEYPHIDDARQDGRILLDLPRDRPIVALPLQYEHEENFFLAHAALPGAIAQIEHLLAALDDAVVLAITDHPLNRLHVDRSAVHALIAGKADRVMFCPQDNATAMLAACADAMVIDLSKTWSLAAFCGTPALNLGRGEVADWLHATSDPRALNRLLKRGALPAIDRAAARRWFGWHLGGRIIDPAALTLERLLRHVDDRPDDGDIRANMDALLARQRVPA